MNLRWTWRIGRIAGIEIGIHPSWLIIYVLLAWSMTAAVRLTEPKLNEISGIVLGLIASLVLFASVVVHEFAHAIVARRLGIPVGNITLFLFGGVASILREPGTPAGELRMAAAGPLASVILALIFGASAWYLSAAQPHWLWAATFCWILAYANAVLAAFNLLPAFPSDGGRLLRAALWWAAKSQARATGIAAVVSAVVAALLAGGGAYVAVVTREPRGLWLMLIGAFLGQAAFASARQARINLALERLRVGDCMARRLNPVPADASVAAFISDLPDGGQAFAYPVVDSGLLLGLITLADAAAVPPALWEQTPVVALMTPASRLPQISADAAACDALTTLASSRLRMLPVFENGVLTGMISEDTIFSALRDRASLAAA